MQREEGPKASARADSGRDQVKGFGPAEDGFRDRTSGPLSCSDGRGDRTSEFAG